MAITGRDIDRIKGPWSPKEDDKLQRLVEKHGPRNWSLIIKSSRAQLERSSSRAEFFFCSQIVSSMKPFFHTIIFLLPHRNGQLQKIQIDQLAFAYTRFFSPFLVNSLPYTIIRS
ncbi:unnamed protein product [Linum trigynum]|uniref:Uncharacterized protein n=1 Tax=Linum trigynum TaxID=586398 RepID=A0AAV2E1Q8_9ROSI